MLGRFTCFISGNHKYEDVRSYEGKIGNAGGLIHTEQECKRCGRTRTLTFANADLLELAKQGMETACQKKPSK